MQINRLLDIVYVLLQEKTVTAKTLAERFGVSSRTIYRDIDTLSLSGIPIYTEKGKNGGISLLPEFVLSKSILSEQEQNEILSSLHGLSNIKTGETEQVLQKLSAVFNKTAANWLKVDFSDWSHMNGSFFNDFKTAILERRIAEFDYYGASTGDFTYGEKTHRRIEPIQLWFKHKAWYIKGFCLTRQDVRLFKLSRVRSLFITDEVFPERCLVTSVHPDEPDPHQKKDVTLKLRIAPQMAYRVYDEFNEEGPYGDYVHKQDDGSFEVKATMPEDDWVYGMILSYGEYIEVLEPEHIRKIIKDKSQKIGNKYQGNL